MSDLSAHGIFVTSNVVNTLTEVLSSKKYTRIGILVDENTKEHCLPIIQGIPHHCVIEIKSGEEQKNLTTCTYIWQALTDHLFDRKSVLINLGGGVIGDMGGFCAATYKRGIDFIQVPTTLLSQVDASAGGKLGIDFQLFKNHIGVFKDPEAVIIFTDFINTLHPREVRSGFAEIIKHCLIADVEGWKNLINTKFPNLNWNDWVPHSIRIKASVTQADPYEAGLRKILNFGHTIGHAIESYYLGIPSKKLLHGEAIAIGMITESYLAKHKGYISAEDLASIESFILSVFGHTPVAESDFENIIPLALQDKKNEQDTIQASLLEKVGIANYNISITSTDIADAIRYYNTLRS